MSKQITLALIAAIGLAPAASAEQITCEPDAPRVMWSTMVFVSNQHDPTSLINAAAEIYLIAPDGTALRLTDNADRDTLPALSPDGKGTIVFDSNRVRRFASPPEPNSSDLFVMKLDGSHQRFLTRGSSASWSPDGKSVAFHRSASDQFVPPVGNPSPGAPTNDSDIFIVRVRQGEPPPTNLTFEEADRVYINEDADWSPDGKRIAFARRSVLDNNFPSNSGDIWVMNADGTGKQRLTGLTGDIFEDKSPAWSPDSQFIAYSCRLGHANVAAQNPPEICVIKADGSDPYPSVLTNTPAQGELGPHFVPSLDGNKILYQRPLPGHGQQIWIMDADGQNQTQLTSGTDGTNPLGTNQFPNWGVIKIPCDAAEPADSIDEGKEDGESTKLAVP
jgi:Tol biopolymer transport system component